MSIKRIPNSGLAERFHCASLDCPIGKGGNQTISTFSAALSKGRGGDDKTDCAIAAVLISDRRPRSAFKRSIHAGSDRSSICGSVAGHIASHRHACQQLLLRHGKRRKRIQVDIGNRDACVDHDFLYRRLE